MSRYYFVAARGFQDLCEAPGAGPKAAPLARVIIESIRKCLVSDSPKVYEVGLLALEQYARAVGPELTPHLKLVIGQISKKMTMGKMRDRLTEVRYSAYNALAHIHPFRYLAARTKTFVN
jgi:hypothetical protein